MNPEGLIQSTQSIQLAEQLLTQALGHPVRLGAGQSPSGGSGRANVLRSAVLDGPSAAPASVIIKTINVGAGETYDPDAQSGPALRLFNEWASLQFLTLLAPDGSLAARFYGGDRQHGLIVIEDLGTGDSLVQPLLGTDRTAAETAVEAYFRSLGRLNAMTYGHHAEYQNIRDQLGASEHLTLEDVQPILLRQFTALCTAVGVTPAPGSPDDLVQAAQFRTDPGPFTALSQGDTCPDNCMYDGQWFRFFDFEWGWFGNALNDGARARSNLPTCWCVNRLPEALIRRAEQSYRAELAQRCPAATDDSLFFQELVKACAFWTLYMFEGYGDLWATDYTWGAATVRQRALLRLDLLAQVSAEYGYLEALGETARLLARRLHSMWPELEPMPYYPPFRS